MKALGCGQRPPVQGGSQPKQRNTESTITTRFMGFFFSYSYTLTYTRIYTSSACSQLLFSVIDALVRVHFIALRLEPVLPGLVPLMMCPPLLLGPHRLGEQFIEGRRHPLVFPRIDSLRLYPLPIRRGAHKIGTPQRRMIPRILIHRLQSTVSVGKRGSVQSTGRCRGRAISSHSSPPAPPSRPWPAPPSHARRPSPLPCAAPAYPRTRGARPPPLRRAAASSQRWLQGGPRGGAAAEGADRAGSRCCPCRGRRHGGAPRA